jgi:hypothetical protein
MGLHGPPPSAQRADAIGGGRRPPIAAQGQSNETTGLPRIAPDLPTLPGKSGENSISSTRHSAGCSLQPHQGRGVAGNSRNRKGFRAPGTLAPGSPLGLQDLQLQRWLGGTPFRPQLDGNEMPGFPRDGHAFNFRMDTAAVRRAAVAAGFGFKGVWNLFCRKGAAAVGAQKEAYCARRSAWRHIMLVAFAFLPDVTGPKMTQISRIATSAILSKMRD